MIRKVLDGALTFDCTYRTNGSDSVSRRLLAAIQTGNTIGKDEVAVAALLTLMLSVTRRIDFHDTTSEQVRGFADFWDWCWHNVFVLEDEDGQPVAVDVIDDSAVLAQLWPRFRRKVSNRIQDEWYAAYKAAQDLYPAEPEMKPDAELTAAQKADPDFLTGDASGGKPSATGASSKPKPQPATA